ncbi:EF-hand [Rhizopus microsporus ATCC 52813]|uniref:EF-hand n=1 Tax=Rhizopus microsporus ATCC 52813 TaxID=1340429 RepID=A0A2G4T093_RHIZD|nr:EF-hand [Rhizopus microsporus ATCC 52813]PHZ14439.1 EF-hand [Rhizopus microsporus ATCC 52813]
MTNSTTSTASIEVKDYTISQAEINHFKEKYESISGGHGITVEILKELYRIAQVEIPDEQELHAQIRAADSKGHGKVGYDDFLSVMKKQYQVNAEEGASKVFQLLDTDNDGLIGGDDLKRGVALFGDNVSAEEIREMLYSADIDGDGLISYEEFLKIMTPCKVNGQTI